MRFAYSADACSTSLWMSHWIFIFMPLFNVFNFNGLSQVDRDPKVFLLKIKTWLSFQIAVV